LLVRPTRVRACVPSSAENTLNYIVYSAQVPVRNAFIYRDVYEQPVVKLLSNRCCARSEVGFPTVDQGFSSIQGTLRLAFTVFKYSV